jgi:predicted MFS family arabinose efflux permease
MVGVSLTAFTLSASIFSLFLYLTLYIQDDLGYSPLAAGIRFLPITLMSFAVAPIAGRLTVRLPARVLLGTGLLLVAVGCGLMAFTTASSGWVLLLPGFIVGGAGIGMVNPPLASSAIAVVPPERSGMASGINSTFRQVGIATGIAALGAVFQSQIRTKVTGALTQSAAGRAALATHGAQLGPALASGGVRTAARSLPPAQAQAVLHAYQSGFSDSINLLMWIGAGLALLGSVCAYWLIRQRDFVSDHQPSPADPVPVAA